MTRRDTMKIVIPSSKNLVETLWKFYNENEPFVAEISGLGSVCFFHYDGSRVPKEVLWEVENGVDFLFCCFPERLPSYLRRKHLFPHKKGIRMLLLPEKEEKQVIIFK
jgi:hypothetical protein